MREATVLLGVDDPGLQDEVLDFLDRRPAVRVVGAATDPKDVTRSVLDRRPDAVVASPSLASVVADERLLVVDRRETTQSLRDAIRAGASGFYLWPDEREALASDAEASMRRSQEPAPQSGSVVAVLPARGGVGATFLATNLAAACARHGASTILVDLDMALGDTAWVLGDAEAPGTVADLVPVVDELGPEHVARVAGTHPAGFRFLASDGRSVSRPDRLAEAVVAATRQSFAITVLHLPRAVDAVVGTAVAAAGVVVLVATLDVPALRAAQRTLDLLDEGGLRGRCRLVVNRAGRGEIATADAAEALGVPVACVIPSDREVERAQNRGDLVMQRKAGTAARRVLRLAAAIVEEVGT